MHRTIRHSIRSLKVSQCAYLVLHYHEPSGITDGLLVILPALVGAILFAGPLTLWSCVTTTASYFFVLVLSVVLYRLSPFHPLAHFPGPVLNKATKLAGVWTTWTGHQHLTNQELHVKYGPFVRVGKIIIGCNLIYSFDASY